MGKAAQDIEQLVWQCEHDDGQPPEAATNARAANEVTVRIVPLRKMQSKAKRAPIYLKFA